MNFKDALGVVLKYVQGRKLRTWLTVLGIVIGIASIVALVATSRSLEASVTKQFEEFGADKINIFASATGAGSLGLGGALNTKDVDAVNRVKDYELVIGLLSKSAKVTYKGQSVAVFVTGFDSDKAKNVFKEFNLDFRDGSTFTADSEKVVIGPRIADDLFGKRLFVGSKIEIEGAKFEVVGITESLGNPQDDSNVYMPLKTMQGLFKDDTSISYIFGKVRAGSDINQVAKKTENELARIRSKESVEVVTPEQLLEQLSSILGILQGVLVGIAAISLLVGSVGIASSMYTSVLERTRDIGIMKAVGATNFEITLIFLVESALLGLAGGIIGIIVGIGIANAIGFAAAQAGFSVLKITIEPLLVVFALAFAVIVGMLSGFFPARKAAMLKPVDALRK